MKKVLNYGNDQEQELYVEEVLDLDGKSLKCSAGTIAGSIDKPNEDAFAVAVDGNILLAAVFDGCTSLKATPNLTSETGAHFASHFLKDAIPSLDTKETAGDLLLELNAKLLAKSMDLGVEPTDLLALPGSSGTLIKMDFGENKLSFAHIGDSYCAVYFKDYTSSVLTDDKNAIHDQKMFELMKQISVSKGISIRQTRQDAEVVSALEKSFIGKFNNPDGSGCGLVNGDPNMQAYLQAGDVDLGTVSAVLLGSDGLLPQNWSIKDEDGRQKALEVLENEGIKKLLQLKKESEDSDPDWEHVRYKHSDDGTGILIKFL